MKVDFWSISGFEHSISSRTCWTHDVRLGMQFERIISKFSVGAQTVVGSIVWALRRLKNLWSREMSARGYALHCVCPQFSFPILCGCGCEISHSTVMTPLQSISRTPSPTCWYLHMRFPHFLWHGDILAHISFNVDTWSFILAYVIPF